MENGTFICMNIHEHLNFPFHIGTNHVIIRVSSVTDVGHMTNEHSPTSFLY